MAVTTEAGTKLEGKSYLPYGLTRGAADIAGTEYQFTDQERDASTGLYNYDARLYDPVIGRFLSADSIVPDPFDPQSFNRYSYVQNSPLVFIDPTGHQLGSPQDPDLSEVGTNTFGWQDNSGGSGNSGNPFFEIANNYLVQPTIYWGQQINFIVIRPIAQVAAIPDTFLDSIFGNTYEDRMGYAASSPYFYDDIAFGVVGTLGRLPRLIGGSSNGIVNRGGRFAVLDKFKQPGEVAHHMPQNAFNRTNGTSRANGPALGMTIEDHALTRTFRGRGKATMRTDAGLTARQRMAVDLQDIRSNFGRKYNQGALKMINYAKSLQEYGR